MAHEIAWTPAAQRSLRKVPIKVGHAVVELIYEPLAETRSVSARRCDWTWRACTVRVAATSG